MAQSTGPILAAGGLTWANQTILSDDPTEHLFERSTRIVVTTALLAGVFFGLEKISPAVAVPLAWTALVTAAIIRVNGKPGPIERALDLVA
jgi:hypothetical protein